MARRRPIPGELYVVQRNDTFGNIAERAYGDVSLADRIIEANQFELQGFVIEKLYEDQIISIPYLPEEQSLRTLLTKSRLSNRDKYDLTLIIDGETVLPQAARIRRQIDSAADGWTATVPWIPGEDKQLDRIAVPYSYLQAAVYIGGELIINGLLYNVTRKATENSITLDLAGWSYSVDAVDSTLKPPYQQVDETIKSVADLLVRPLGIRAVFVDDPGEPFKRITADPQETIFTHLAKYASQRAFLVSNTPTGDLLFLRANTDQAPVGTVEETRPPVNDWVAKFDGRKLFNAYRAIGQSPGRNSKSTVAVDWRVPRSRFLTFTADDTTASDIQTAAEWRRSKQLAEALTLQLPVTDWYAPDGNLWRENTIVTVVSEVLGVPQGYNFLIRSVEYDFKASGQTALLSLVPPAVYTGEPIDYPWTQ